MHRYLDFSRSTIPSQECRDAPIPCISMRGAPSPSTEKADRIGLLIIAALGFLGFKPIGHELACRSPILWIDVGNDDVHLLRFVSAAPQEAIRQLLHQSSLLLSSSAL